MAVVSNESFPVEHEPMTVQTRYRCYTDREQRRRLGVTGNPYGTQLTVGFVNEQGRDGDGAVGQRGRYATTGVWLSEYGEFTIPKSVREHLAVDVGDVVLVTIDVRT